MQSLLCACWLPRVKTADAVLCCAGLRRPSRLAAAAVLHSMLLKVGLACPAVAPGGLSNNSLDHMLHCLFWAPACLSDKHQVMGTGIEFCRSEALC